MEGGKYWRTLSALLNSIGPETEVIIATYVDAQSARAPHYSAELIRLAAEYYARLLERTDKDKGAISYKRILCFDRNVFSADEYLQKGTLRTGEGPGTIPNAAVEHCRTMLLRSGCSLYVAPVVFPGDIALFGTQDAVITFRRFDAESGLVKIAGVFFFSDPPNGGIIEDLKQIVRDTEKELVAVRRIMDAESLKSTIAGEGEKARTEPRSA